MNIGARNKYNATIGNDKRNMFYTYCQKPRHTVERCFKIHGYPTSFKTNMQENKPRKFQSPNFIQGNAVSAEEDFINVQGTSNQGTQHNSILPSSVGINQEQYSQLIEILQQVKISQQAASSSEVNVAANCAGIAPILPSLFPDKSFIHSWIFDSCASEHMTFDKSILFDIIALTQPLTVNLPNSFKIKVTHAGKVSLFPDMILDRVLYVPSFKFNLLFVHKFCYQFGCDLIFSAFLCSMQGLP